MCIHVLKSGGSDLGVFPFPLSRPLAFPPSPSLPPKSSYNSKMVQDRACQWQPSFVGLVVQCWRALEAMGEVYYYYY